MSFRPMRTTNVTVIDLEAPNQKYCGIVREYQLAPEFEVQKELLVQIEPDGWVMAGIINQEELTFHVSGAFKTFKVQIVI